MTDPECQARLSEVLPRYKRARGETREAHVARLAGVIHRGWAFLGLGREWFDAQKEQIDRLLPPTP